MPRLILDESRLHPAIKSFVSEFHRNTVDEVARAVDQHPIVVVGMKSNPYCKKARKQLDTAGIAYQYLEYGSYTKDWDPRLALKMWTGWPTFPMVFIKGQFIGGNADLEKLLKSGELKK